MWKLISFYAYKSRLKCSKQTLPIFPVFDSPAKYANVHTVEYQLIRFRQSCANMRPHNLLCKYLQMCPFVSVRKLEEGVLAQRLLCQLCVVSRERQRGQSSHSDLTGRSQIWPKTAKYFWKNPNTAKRNLKLAINSKQLASYALCQKKAMWLVIQHNSLLCLSYLTITKIRNHENESQSVEKHIIVSRAAQI